LTAVAAVNPGAERDRQAWLAGELQRALAAASPDTARLCKLGGAAARLGMHEWATRAFDRTTAILRSQARAGDVGSAMRLELAIYDAFVKTRETELHYESCFGQWREAMADLGRGLREPAERARAGGIGFVLTAGVILGHAEVLFRTLEHRPRDAPPVRIYVTVSARDDFLERARAIGVPVEVCPADDSRGAIAWLRRALRANGDTCAIWVSTPVSASTVLAARVAPVQVFWALRFHPIRLPEIDGYITYGGWNERERIFHGGRWSVAPMPLALDNPPAEAAAVAQLRARFPERVLLGTLAREDKIASRPFLEALAEVLRRHPDAGWMWTGRIEHAGIASFLRERGVADRCHFVGWVDTALHAAALDLFLETFPLGCGITGYQAIAARVALLSLLDPDTIFGIRYWSELADSTESPPMASRERLDEYPLLCARSPAEYVELASRLIADDAYRASWVEREGAFYAEEKAAVGRHAAHFFDAVREIMTRAGAA